MPPYQEFADGPLPVAEAQASRIVSLPMYPDLGLDRVARVAEAVNALVADGGSR
jgi:dTDP-4-amino-4,6-dideoxygalactose transaminase